MEVLFAVAGCLGAFALGLLAGRPIRPRARGEEPAAPDMPPELRRQGDDFVNYTGRPAGGYEHED